MKLYFLYQDEFQLISPTISCYVNNQENLKTKPGKLVRKVCYVNRKEIEKVNQIKQPSPYLLFLMKTLLLCVICD